MKLITVVIIGVIGIIDPIKIGKINTAKTQAREAYTKGDYKAAISKYKYLSDSLGVNEDEVRLNLANSYFLSKDTTNASSAYQSLTGSVKPAIRSKAQHQLGVMNHKSGKLEEALENFKQAIKADPANRDARYNYEMLKKKLEEEKKKQQQDEQNRDKDNKENQKEQEKKEQQQKDQQQKDQQKKEEEKKEQEKKEQEQKDQQKKDQQNKDQQQKDEKQSEEEKQDKEKKDQQLSQKLQQMKISEEKAKMILEAMKNQEIQYLQQNKRKATKPKDKSKPDW